MKVFISWLRNLDGDCAWKIHDIAIQIIGGKKFPKIFLEQFSVGQVFDGMGQSTKLGVDSFCADSIFP